MKPLLLLIATLFLVGCNKSPESNQVQTPKLSVEEANRQYTEKLANKLDKEFTKRCIAASLVGYVRAKNNGSSPEVTNLYSGMGSLWGGMLIQVGYLNGNEQAIKEEASLLASVLNQNFSDSGLKMIWDDCLKKLDVNNF